MEKIEMIIGVYQFASTGDITSNLKKITYAINSAAEKGIDLIAFHECALCGYPPIESEIEKVNKQDVDSALKTISDIAGRLSINVAVGTIRFESKKKYNSVILFGRDGSVRGIYDKKALWGWDVDNFERGSKGGIFDIEGVKIGFRICFDVRFPELFRELYSEKADLCIVCLSDTSKEEKMERYSIIKFHLISRAVENVMTVISVNSTTDIQTAPTAVFDCNGETIMEAEAGKEMMLVYDFEKPEITFGMRGRIENNKRFIK